MSPVETAGDRRGLKTKDKDCCIWRSGKRRRPQQRGNRKARSRWVTKAKRQQHSEGQGVADSAADRSNERIKRRQLEVAPLRSQRLAEQFSRRDGGRGQAGLGRRINRHRRTKLTWAETPRGLRCSAL